MPSRPLWRHCNVLWAIWTNAMLPVPWRIACLKYHYSDVKWLPWHLDSPALQQFVQTGWHQRKHQSSASLPLCEWNPPVTDGFPSQRIINAESVVRPRILVMYWSITTIYFSLKVLFPQLKKKHSKRKLTQDAPRKYTNHLNIILSKLRYLPLEIRTHRSLTSVYIV